MVDVAWPPAGDDDLDTAATELYRLDPTGDRVAAVLRDTFDQLYDGHHSGRWNFNDLHKTEKTHMGTLVEINLHREFDFDDGDTTDYRIAGVQVDCKYSMKPFGWMLPPEVIGEIALLVTANDEASTWGAGLLRVTPEVVRGRRTETPRRRSRRRGDNAFAGSGTIIPDWRPTYFTNWTRPRGTPIFGAKSARGDAARAGAGQRVVPTGPRSNRATGRTGHSRPTGRFHETGARQRRRKDDATT